MQTKSIFSRLVEDVENRVAFMGRRKPQNQDSHGFVTHERDSGRDQASERTTSTWALRM